MNFPSELQIQASEPSAALSHFTNHDSALPAPPISDDEPWISSQSADIQTYGIAGRIWEAAYAMSLYLQSPPSWEFEPPCSLSSVPAAIIELGSGTGYLGFRLARTLSSGSELSSTTQKTLILTDLEAVCPLLCRNGQHVNNLPGVDLVIRPLEWGNQGHGDKIAAELMARQAVSRGSHPLSHIVCSDLVYFPELFAPLLRTLLQLSSPPFSSAAEPVQIIISYMIRSLPKESPFWSAFGTWFDFSPVLTRQKSELSANTPWERFGSHKDGTMFIFVANRKPESLRWPVPDDSELMRGCDETFETLLLMNIVTD